MQNINLTPLFQAFIGLLAAVVSWWVIPWIKAHTTEKQQANLAAAARTAVYAAQQIYGANRDENDAKLRAALEFLRDAGFDFDEAILRQAVEQAVYDMKQAIAREEMHEKVLASFDEETGTGVLAARVPVGEALPAIKAEEAEAEWPAEAAEAEPAAEEVQAEAAEKPEAVQTEAPDVPDADAEPEAEPAVEPPEAVQAEAGGKDPAEAPEAEQPTQPPDA